MEITVEYFLNGMLGNLRLKDKEEMRLLEDIILEIYLPNLIDKIKNVSITEEEYKNKILYEENNSEKIIDEDIDDTYTYTFDWDLQCYLNRQSEENPNWKLEEHLTCLYTREKLSNTYYEFDIENLDTIARFFKDKTICYCRYSDITQGYFQTADILRILEQKLSDLKKENSTQFQDFLKISHKIPQFFQKNSF